MALWLGKSATFAYQLLRKDDVMDGKKNIEDIEVQPMWLSYEQASVYSGICRTRLWTLCKQGDIFAAKVGASVRINRESLDEYLFRHAMTAKNGR